MDRVAPIAMKVNPGVVGSSFDYIGGYIKPNQG